MIDGTSPSWYFEKLTLIDIAVKLLNGFHLTGICLFLKNALRSGMDISLK
jgi:hypothetical protein